MKPTAIWTFLITMIVCVILGGDTANYYRDSNLDSYDCKSGDYAFNAYPVRSKIDCALRCEGDSSCKSVFYVTGAATRLCNGCTVKYNSTNASSLGLNSLSGSVHYANTIDYDMFDFTWQNSGYIIPGTSQNFDDGTVLCNHLGGYPATLDTQEENDFVRNTLIAIGAGHAFIGLYQPGAAGTDWVWRGNGEVMVYNGFHSGEPNQANEQCVCTISTWGHEWADLHCSIIFPILCEFEI